MIASPGVSHAMDPHCHSVGAPPRQEVMFADGSALMLHRISDAAEFERRIPLGNGEWLRVDLRQLAPDLAGKLPGASTRDVASDVFHSLCKRYTSAAQLLQSAGGH